MRRPALFWAGTIGGLVAVDIWAHTNATDGDTLSEQVRPLFHTPTPPPAAWRSSPPGPP